MAERVELMRALIELTATRLPDSFSLTWSVHERTGRLELCLWSPRGYTFHAVDMKVVDDTPSFDLEDTLMISVNEMLKRLA